MRTTRTLSNPVEPFATAVGWTTGLLTALLLLSLLVHQSLWGDGPVCVSVSGNDILGLSGTVSPAIAAAGSHATLETAQVCASDPTGLLRLAGLLAGWPYIIVWLVFLIKLGRTLKVASRPGGLYSSGTEAGLRALGRLLVVGGIAASIVESAARITIFVHLVSYQGARFDWFQPAQATFSVTTLLVGLGFVSAARIMRLGVTMRDELDVTI